MAVTMIRHQAIGNKVGAVITAMDYGKFTAVFQIYMQSKAAGSLLLMGSWPWSAEDGAIEHFDNWVKEAQLEAI